MVDIVICVLSAVNWFCLEHICTPLGLEVEVTVFTIKLYLHPLHYYITFTSFLWIIDQTCLLRIIKTIMCLFKYRNEVYILLISNMNYNVALNRPRQFKGICISYIVVLTKCQIAVSRGFKPHQRLPWLHWARHFTDSAGLFQKRIQACFHNLT